MCVSIFAVSVEVYRNAIIDNWVNSVFVEINRDEFNTHQICAYRQRKTYQKE